MPNVVLLPNVILLWVVMLLNVVMPNIVMLLNVILPNVVMLSVVMLLMLLNARCSYTAKWHYAKWRYAPECHFGVCHNGLNAVLPNVVMLIAAAPRFFMRDIAIRLLSC